MTDLRFFESPFEGVGWDQRVYTRSFPRSTTRFVNWELNLAFPIPGRRIDLAIDVVFHRGDGSVVGQHTGRVAVQVGWTNLGASLGQGWADPGFWAIGSYRVELSVDGENVASGWFEIVDDPLATAGAAMPEQVQRLMDRLPWSQDGRSYVEERALGALWRIQGTDQALADGVASLPWTLDGITTDERGALEHLASLAQQDTPLALAVVRLPWLADGVSTAEWDALRRFAMLADRDITLARRVAGLPWAIDDIAEGEQEALEYLAALAQEDASLAAKVVGYPWAADVISEQERWALEYLSSLTEQDVALGGVVAGFPWLADDVAELEWKSLGNLRSLTAQDLALGRTVAGFPWVADDITEPEWEILGNLSPMSEIDVAIARTASGLLWLADDVDGTDLQAVRDLRGIAERNASLAGQVAAMPFLATSLEERDQHALSSILHLAGSPVDLALLTDADWFQDGIDHQEAALVTVLADQAVIAPEEFRSLLGFHEYQSRTVTLALAGDVQLTILRLSPEDPARAQGQMDRLETAVRTMEGFMDLPFPQKDILLLYAETGTQTTGIYLGSHMIVDRPEVIKGNLRRSEAHEVVHYYWHGRSGVPLWFREGAAEFLTSYVIEQADGESLRSRSTVVGGPYARSCARMGMGTLQQLIDDLALVGYEAQQGRPYFSCNYVLGEAFFLEMYAALGPQTFRVVWSEIHQGGEPEGREYTEEQIYDLFIQYASDAGAGAGAGEAEEIYRTWHGGAYP